MRLLGVLFLLLANAFFVATEYATVSSRLSRIDQLIAERVPGAKRARKLIADKDRTLAATQLGITMCSLALGWVGEPFVDEFIQPLLQLLPAAWIEPVAHTISAVIAFIVITALHIVIGEQSPKIWAIRNAERVTMFAAPWLMVFDTIFRPFTHVLDNATTAVLQLLGVPSLSGHHNVHSIEELKRLVSDSQESGLLEESEEEMLHNVFEFGDRQVSEAMVPRPDMVALALDLPVSELLRLMLQHPYTRYPVYDGEVDTIAGILHVRDLFAALHDRGIDNVDVRRLLRPAIMVPTVSVKPSRATSSAVATGTCFNSALASQCGTLRKSHARNVAATGGLGASDTLANSSRSPRRSSIPL